jgi:hypothetical protein
MTGDPWHDLPRLPWILGSIVGNSVGKKLRKNKKGLCSSHNPLFLLAGWKGLEPSASGVTGRRYNQLNYHPICGGRNRARTCDPRLVRPMLSQLSYPPCFARAEQVVCHAAQARISSNLRGGRMSSNISVTHQGKTVDKAHQGCKYRVIRRNQRSCLFEKGKLDPVCEQQSCGNDGG